MPDSAPHFVVRKHDPAGRRWRMLLIVVGVLAAMLAAGVAGFMLGRQIAPVVPDHSRPAAVMASDEELAQQVATLSRSEQVATIALEAMRQTLADRNEEISALRADLQFYSRLVGSGEQRTGIAVHSVHVQPITGSRAYNVTVTLTQNTKRGERNRGRVQLAVLGVLDESLVLLKWDDLGDPQHTKGLPYEFKYFQQLHASIMLPDRFSANRMRITLQPKDGDEVTRTIDWTEALTPENRDVQ